MLHKKTYLILFILIFISITYSIYFYSYQHVLAVKPKRGIAVQSVYATGTVESEIMLPIAPKTAGILSEILADENQTVKQNQILAKFKAQPLIYNLNELKAKESLAETELERDKKLVTKGIISREQLDISSSSYEAAKSARQSAQALIDETELVSPAEGVIIKRDGEIGEFISINTPIFWLAGSSKLRINAMVDEEDIVLIAPGQKVLIRADAFEDKVFDGIVHSVTPKGDPIERNYRVIIELPKNIPLMIGMSTESNIIINESQNALIIPSTAVHEKQVKLIENSKIVNKIVEIGAKNYQETEIKKGLDDNSVVVKDYDKNLSEDMVVRFKFTDNKSKP